MRVLLNVLVVHDRLIFLMYLIALHLWALLILAFHSHQIERMHADTGSDMPAPPGVA
jgi:hypothetical protein